MTEIHRGACLCGGVSFEIHGGFERFFLCHCARCRKDTGSAHAANLFATDARLVWLAGESLVRSFALPGTRHRKWFCGDCGAALPGMHGDGMLVVPAGSLDSPVAQRPDAHIFCASRADWDHALETVAGFDALPG